MEFSVLQGNYKKLFIEIQDIKTKQDFELYEIIKKVLYRQEYKPFIQSFNKTISKSFLYNDYLFPATFWSDVKKQLIQFIPEESIVCHNEELLYNQYISEESFQEFIDDLKLPDDISTEKEQYKFQQDAARLAIKNKIGKIEVGTSGGKTFITYMYCRYLLTKEFKIGKHKIMIIVPNKSLCTQLQKDFEHYQSQEKIKLRIETIYSGAKRLLISDVVVGTFQSLRNYDEDYFEDFYAVICDEVHTAKAYSIQQEIFQKVKNSEYFFGMSGTVPKYNTLDYLSIVSMFGPTVLERTAAKLIETGVSTPVFINCIEIRYLPPYSDYSKDLKDQGIIGTEKYRMEKLFFQNLSERNQLLYKLISKIPGNNIVMVDTVEYTTKICEELNQYFIDNNILDQSGNIKTADFVHGKISNREEIYNKMRNSTDHTIIATFGTMAVGLSIHNLTNLYLPDGGKSFIRIRQAIGRTMRLHPSKKYAQIFDFQDKLKGSAFLSQSYERNKIYREQKYPMKTYSATIPKINKS